MGKKRRIRHPEDICKDCGGPNITWHASSELWNAVVVDRGIIICPICFVKRSEKQGIRPTSWWLALG